MWPFKCDTNRKKVVIRTNVLILMAMAYLTVIALVAAMLIWHDKAATIWDAIEPLFMALIGGTLVISKDLISDDQSTEDDSNNLEQPPIKPSEQKTAEEHQK